MRLSILGALLVTALLACGGSGHDPPSSSNVAAQNAASTSDSAPAEPPPAPVADAGTTEDAAPHDPIDPSKAAMCDGPPVGSFSIEGLPPPYFASTFAHAYDVEAHVASGGGTTGGLSLDFIFPTTAWDDAENGESWGSGVITMAFESATLGVGTHEAVVLDAGDYSSWCSAHAGGGVGGTASNVGQARVTITTRSDTQVEGTLDFTTGGHLEFHAPINVRTTGGGTSCCPKVVTNPD